MVAPILAWTHCNRHNTQFSSVLQTSRRYNFTGDSLYILHLYYTFKSVPVIQNSLTSEIETASTVSLLPSFCSSHIFLFFSPVSASQFTLIPLDLSFSDRQTCFCYCAMLLYCWGFIASVKRNQVTEKNVLISVIPIFAWFFVWIYITSEVISVHVCMCVCVFVYRCT